jgi:hypothetical protein
MQLMPSEMYCDPSKDCSFFDVSRRAVSGLNHVVIGYQFKTNSELTSMNPKDKSSKRNWANANFVSLVRNDIDMQRRVSTAVDVAFTPLGSEKTFRGAGTKVIGLRRGSVRDLGSAGTVSNSSASTSEESGELPTSMSSHVAFLETELAKRTENEIAAWEMLQRNADETQRLRDDSHMQREQYERHVQLLESQVLEFREVREEFKRARQAHEGQVKMLEDKLNDLMREGATSPSRAKSLGNRPLLSRVASTGLQARFGGIGDGYSTARVQATPADPKEDQVSPRPRNSRSAWGQSLQKEKQAMTRNRSVHSHVLVEESTQAARQPMPSRRSLESSSGMAVEEAELDNSRVLYSERAKF